MINFDVIFEALTDLHPEGTTRFFSGAEIDSRQLLEGKLFIAIPGEQVDGHAFVTKAFRSGAVAALIEHVLEKSAHDEFEYALIDLRQHAEISLQKYQEVLHTNLPVCFLVDNTILALQKIAAAWRRKLNIRVIGITGSVGKSTTKEAVSDVLNQHYRTLKSAANLNNEIGLPLNILRLTTEHERAVLEMGFYVPGEIKLLCDIAQPQVGILTNIGTVHAERAGSMEIIASGKSELVQALPAGPQGTAILNKDDPYIRRMKSQSSANIFYYGTTSQADLWADEIIGLGLDGIKLQLHYRDQNKTIHVPMIGRHSAYTVLRAAAAGLVEGLSWDEIITGLQVKRDSLRLSVLKAKSGATIIDDTYNASPDSTLAALDLLMDMPGKKVAVLGDMLELGQYEQEGHEKIGERAAQVADTLITLGSRARMIAGAAKEAGMSPANIIENNEKEPIVEWLNNNLTAEHSVLIKGSHGLHMEQIVSALELSK